MNYHSEIQRTAPDFVTYVPKGDDGSTGDTGNEHFLVTPLPRRPGGLFAIWTQSTYEGTADQHINFSASHDGGKTWTTPRSIAQRDEKAGLGMASWAFPLVSKSGRIYVLFSRHIGVNDIATHTTGLMACIHSDDEGATWSQQVILPMPRSCWDHPDPKVPANWIVWQKPIRLRDGRYFTGWTHWVSAAVRPPRPRPEWWADAAVVEFMRFENIDDDPAPEDIRITWLAANERALRVGLAGHPDVPALQEPSVVELPDGRLFCVMRTTVGSPYYSVSADTGESWTRPEPLRRYDDGPLLLHPCSPCPIYPLDDENFAFFYHNHNGYFLDYTPSETGAHRRPVCLARAGFRPGAHQPLWFSEPWFFMDNGGIPIRRADLAMYASSTPYEEGIVLWYPERKFFLLGKKIPAEMIRNLVVRKRGAGTEK